MRSGYVVVALLLVACASAPRVDVARVPHGVRLTTRIDFYDVPGTTVSALRADITHTGPRIDDRSWAGSTDWNARWSWEYDHGGTASCAFRRVTVELSTVTLLPRSTPNDVVDQDVLSWWTNMSARLVAAIEPLSALTCSQLANNANASAQQVIEHVKGRQAEVDQATGHGRRLIPPDSIAVR